MRRALVLGVALAFVGCRRDAPAGDDGGHAAIIPSTAAPASASPSSVRRDTCAILTAVDAATAIGGPAALDPANPPKPGVCTYVGGASNLTNVTLQVDLPGAKQYDFDKSVFHGTVDVPGVGDRAFQTGGSGFSAVTTLHVMKGSQYFWLSFSFNDTRKTTREPEIVKKLALRILPKI